VTDVKVVEVRRERRNDGREGWFAAVDVGDLKFGFSRLDGEEDWTADSLIGPGSYPHFVHGFGSRVTIPRVAQAEVAAAIQAAVEEVE
jgi:hypothetical protein